jgi:ADP-dependent NAD(P)H-hydrate dehydratase / NAD(P)H-hydrate epimerase
VIELLTSEEMRAADAAAITAGTPGMSLMEAAGRAVADQAVALCPAPGPVLVVCGPGNNGGDGFVAARLLAGRRYEVRLALLGERDTLKGDAAGAARRWNGEVRSFEPSLILGCALIVDAIFGSGLVRDIDGAARGAIEAMNASGKPVLAVDIPSGVDSDSGLVRGAAVKASTTVTFFRFKPGHKLLPGRALAGTLQLAQIGVPDTVLDRIPVRTGLDRPALWGDAFPRPDGASHKYARGHALIAAGSEMTGAARLAARAARRAGAGVVTLTANPEVVSIYQTALEAVIVRPMAGLGDYVKLLDDDRRNALLIGPGAGHGEETRDLVRASLSSGRAVVLDADALTSFETQPRALFSGIADREQPVVMTPHEGEFKRLFRQVFDATPSKLERAREAAKLSGAVVVFKGADTVIAAPDGRVAIADNGPPWLATAGSGDVLAGIVTGLLAQKMPGFEAACAAVWMHGEAGTDIGPGLIAEDLPDALRGVLRGLLS